MSDSLLVVSRGTNAIWRTLDENLTLLIGGLTYQVNTSMLTSIVWALVSDSVVEFVRTPGVSISLIKSLCSFVLIYVLVSTDVSPQQTVLLYPSVANRGCREGVLNEKSPMLVFVSIVYLK